MALRAVLGRQISSTGEQLGHVRRRCALRVAELGDDRDRIDSIHRCLRGELEVVGAES